MRECKTLVGIGQVGAYTVGRKRAKMRSPSGGRQRKYKKVCDMLEVAF